ncbi:uncharacterized protein N7482_004971 [Penicillium canariense]|uniref:Uncharacterized protein n=1 Tax=Penicillium canariense TaxID=189055 RepID=A0A9W9I3V7_9EURO|nr:uncharacterized protein N7482_004971 [Penicillium canariense]KAJ5166190.1 hypothetical protein N7482_004971 [Penicillium canariense]
METYYGLVKTAVCHASKGAFPKKSENLFDPAPYMFGTNMKEASEDGRTADHGARVGSLADSWPTGK